MFVDVDWVDEFIGCGVFVVGVVLGCGVMIGVERCVCCVCGRCWWCWRDDVGCVVKCEECGRVGVGCC